MPIKASAVGAHFGERTVEITPRMMLAYAAGIGATGRWTFDDADADGFIAPPQLCVTLEWPTVSDTGMRNLLGMTRDEMLRTLHVGQDSYFHKPIVAGQRLTIRGTVVAIRDTHSGAITLSKIESTDDKTGEPIVTSWSTALMRGVMVDGTSEPIAEKPDVQTGTVLEQQLVDIPIAREMPHIYSECAAIWNPIHTERKVALSIGLPDIILHGTATWAIAGREIIRNYADGDPRRLRRLGGRFGAIVIPGTTITLEHGISAEDRNAICFSVRNNEGEESISDGIAELETT